MFEPTCKGCPDETPPADSLGLVVCEVTACTYVCKCGSDLVISDVVVTVIVLVGPLGVETE